MENGCLFKRSTLSLAKINICIYFLTFNKAFFVSVMFEGIGSRGDEYEKIFIDSGAGPFWRISI